MLPSAIIDKALLDTHTNSAEYDPATKWIVALNIVYDEVNNQIVENVREDYFWDVFKVTTVDSQVEYNISTAWITWDGVPDTPVNLKKVNKVFVKYDSSDTYYTPVEYIAPETLTEDFDKYADSQSKSNPFYYVQDRSIFVYPKPSPWVIAWLKMNAIYTPPAVLLASPETWLALQKDKHYIYSLWMEEQIYKSQGKLNEASNARAIFNRELTKLMTYLKTRVNEAKIKTMDSLDSYS